MSRRVRVSTLRRARRRLSFAFAGQGKKAGVALASTVAATLLDLAKPWPAAFVIDSVLDRGLGGAQAVFLVVAAGMGLAGLSWLVGLLNYRANLEAAEVGRVATTRVRRKLFEHLNRLSLPFHTSSRVGDLLVRLTGDVTLVRDLLFTSWISLIDLGVQLAGIAAIMLVLDWPVFLVVLAPMIHLWITSRRATRELRSAVRQQRKRQGRAAAVAAESLAQIRVVKAYGAEEIAVGRFDADSRSEETEGFRAAEISAGMERRVAVLSGLGSGLVLVVGGLRVLAGAVTLGGLVVLISYAKSLFKPLRKISNEVTRVAKASAVTERLLEVLETEPEDHDSGHDAPPLAGHIEFRGVSFGYPGGRPLLAGASVVIEPGSLVAVVGANGEGKSTALSLILRLLEPTAGRILIDGRPIDSFRLTSIRRRMAYVPQDLRLFSGSVADNVRFGKPDASLSQVKAALRLAHFGEVLERLPDGLETELGEGGSTLSGGEARRLMLARAAVRDADILLLDEPFAGLDPAARPAVAMSIRSIAAGRTTIVVAHGELEELSPDVVIALRNGKLLATSAGRSLTA